MMARSMGEVNVLEQSPAQRPEKSLLPNWDSLSTYLRERELEGDWSVLGDDMVWEARN